MQNSHLPIPLASGYRLQNWYEIGQVLGQGRCGITYQAYDCNLERTVAIKEYLPAELAHRDSGVFVQPGETYGEDAYHIGLETFLNEARVLAKQEYSNTPSIINVFVAHNTAYMVMSHEEGESLEALLQRRRTLEEAELLKLLMPLLGVLEKIHESGHIHGDLKPPHILIRADGNPVLLDFGATRRTVAELSHTAVHTSPGYSAPEAYFGRKEQLGPSADIYGLAAVLYRAVAGVAPPDALERSQSVISGSRDPILPCMQMGGQRYSENLLRTIDCALKLDPDQRPQSIAAWRREFGSSPGGLRSTSQIPREADPGFAATARWPQRSRPQRQSRARLITGGLLAAALLGLGGRAWFNRHDRSVHPDELARQEPSLAKNDATPQPLPLASPSPPLAAVATPADAADNALENRVGALLSQARADLESGRLFDPKDDNALAKYRTILALKPGLAEAREGLRQIADELIRKSRQTMEKHDWTRAQEYLDQAGSVLPELDKLAVARRDLHARMLEFAKQRQAAGETAKADHAGSAAQLATAARRAMDRQQWEKAEADINKVATLMPGFADLPQLRRELQEARQEADNPSLADEEMPLAENRALQTYLKRAKRAIDRRHWEKAQTYIDKAEALAPETEEVALLQGELNLSLSGEQTPTEPAAPVPPVTAPAPQAHAQAQVQIRNVGVSLPVARPGQTLEFVTEYVLTLPEGENDRQVTATWALTRNGRRLGQDGTTSMPAKAGTHSTSTDLTLPPFMKAGTYVVEHHVASGNSHDVARSSFRVESR